MDQGEGLLHAAQRGVSNWGGLNQRCGPSGSDRGAPLGGGARALWCWQDKATQATHKHAHFRRTGWESFSRGRSTQTAMGQHLRTAYSCVCSALNTNARGYCRGEKPQQSDPNPGSQQADPAASMTWGGRIIKMLQRLRALINLTMLVVLLFHVNIESHDTLMSLSRRRAAPSSSLSSSVPSHLVYSLPLPLSSLFLFCFVFCWIYTDANSAAGCVAVQLFCSLVHRDFPITATLPPWASTSPSPLFLPPPSALLPIWGDPGAVLRVPHTPEAVSGLLPSHERNTQ